MIRTVTPSTPVPRTARKWVARSLLEAPDDRGKPGNFEAIEVQTSGLSGAYTTTNAVHSPGWYMIQWYSDDRQSVFSEPVRLEGAFGAGVTEVN